MAVKKEQADAERKEIEKEEERIRKIKEKEMWENRMSGSSLPSLGSLRSSAFQSTDEEAKE